MEQVGSARSSGAYVALHSGPMMGEVARPLCSLCPVLGCRCPRKAVTLGEGALGR